MKRGQSALEYLMTYGWALVIILVAAAALYAMGLLSPSTYQQKTCTGLVTLGYQDHFFDGSDFKIRVANEAGAKIKVDEFNVTVEGQEYNYSTPTNINAGKQATLTVTGFSGFAEGDDYIADLEFTYDIPGGIQDHVERGSCTGKIE